MRVPNETAEPNTERASTDEKSAAIARIYVNHSEKDNKEYLKLYVGDEKFAAFKPRASANKEVGDYEFYDKVAKQVIIKVNRRVEGDKESLKVEFFDPQGKFVKSFIAYKTKEKKSDKSPDYTAYAKTLKLA